MDTFYILYNMTNTASCPAWSDHAVAADLELHEIILQSCGNRQLAHEIERYNVLMRAIRRVAGNLYNVQLGAVSEHLQIINAFLVGTLNWLASG